jgi:hypothetical protein
LTCQCWHGAWAWASAQIGAQVARTIGHQATRHEGEDMSKSQHGNKEAKKPKKAAPVVDKTAPPLAVAARVTGQGAPDKPRKK